MARFDTDKLRRDFQLSDYLPLRGIALKRNGNEFECACPFHAENTPSFQIYRGKRGTQEFKCQGCGEKGDVLDFIQKWDNLSFDEACEVLGGKRVVMNDRKSVSDTHPPGEDVYAHYTALLPPPNAEVFEPGKRSGPIRNPKRPEKPISHYRPSSVHPYHNAKGKLVGYVLRIDLEDGKKLTPCILWCRHEGTGEEGWCHRPMKQDGRPMYGLPALKVRPQAQVLVFGGERKTDEAQALLPTTACVSYLGGDQNAGKTDWSQLGGRDVIIWPDNDDSGQRAAETIAEAATAAGALRVRIVQAPGAERPKGWDVGDAIKEGWTKAEIVAWAKDRAAPWIPPREGASTAPETKTAPEAREQRADSQPPRAPEALIPTQQIKPDPEPEDKPEPEQRRKPRPVADPDSNVIRLQADLDPTPREDGKPWQSYLELDDKGSPKPKLMTNFVAYMQRHPKMRGVLAKNLFTQDVTLLRAPPWENPASFQPRAMTDNDATRAGMWMEGARLTPTPNQAGLAMTVAAEAAAFDPVRDYLNGLAWDGLPRLSTWLLTHMGVMNTKNGIERLFGRNWLIAAVARNLTTKPDGEKVDNMLVFEGAQGKRKSMALEVLATMNGVRYFTDSVDDITSKDAIMQMRNAVIVEIGELASLEGASVEMVKKWASKRVDSFRPPYGKNVIDLPRRSVLAGTVNPSGIGYLRDATGGRRFWPVRVSGEVDIGALVRDRDQLWAEAVHLYRAGERWWLEGYEVEMAGKEQSKRFQDDPWADGISEFLEQFGHTIVTVDKIFRHLEIPRHLHHAKNHKRITDQLKHLGYESKLRRVGQRQSAIRVWTKQGDDNGDAEDFN